MFFVNKIKITLFLALLSAPILTQPVWAANDAPYLIAQNDESPSQSDPNYNVDPTDSNFKDMAYIMDNLANSSLLSLWASEKEIRTAGEHFRGLHPLKTLSIIFMDAGIKANFAKAANGEGIAWTTFKEEYAKSLEEESNHHNLSDQMIDDFSKRTGIDESQIEPLLKSGQYDQFMDTLAHVAAQ